jgi:hypothetical protein
MRGAWAAFAKDPIHGLHSYDGWLSYRPNGTTLIRLAYGNERRNNNTRVGFILGPSLAYDANC